MCKSCPDTTGIGPLVHAVSGYPHGVALHEGLECVSTATDIFTALRAWLVAW